MKIAVSGCAGVGKTTLAGALANALGVPLIPEQYDPLFNQPGKFMGPDSSVLVPDFQSILRNKRSQEVRYGDFVTDRCPIDLFHLWMARGLGKLEDKTAAFHDACRDSVQDYELVVIPPWDGIEFRQIDSPPDLRYRTMNKWIQLHNHACITGYACLWISSARLELLPMQLQSIDDRVAHVLRRLGVEPECRP